MSASAMRASSNVPAFAGKLMAAANGETGK